MAGLGAATSGNGEGAAGGGGSAAAWGGGGGESADARTAGVFVSSTSISSAFIGGGSGGGVCGGFGPVAGRPSSQSPSKPTVRQVSQSTSVNTWRNVGSRRRGAAAL